MSTPRYSSLWDRWRGDEASYSREQWEAWLQANYPTSVARDPDGGYIDPNDNPRSWQITPETLANTVWSYLRNTIPGATAAERAAEVTRRFSFSAHELAQMADIRDYITAAGSSLNQLMRWTDLCCLMAEVEQRVRTDKAAIYALLGIRADAQSG